MPSLSTELFWLTLTIIMTACFWVPYIINRIMEHRLWPALRNPQPDAAPKSQWAHRMMKAHANAVENLVLFAPLVLMIEQTGLHSSTTVLACQVYFFARLAHYFIYTFGIPVLRTLAFAIGFTAQMMLAAVLFGWL